MVSESPCRPFARQCVECAAAVEAACRRWPRLRSDGRGFHWRVAAVTVPGHPDLTAYVERFVLEGQTPAPGGSRPRDVAHRRYKHPLSRAQIAAIRASRRRLRRTLQARGYIEEIARDRGRPGCP